MQKILLILISMFIGTAHATEMCAKNNTVVIPLDATITSSDVGNNKIEWMWWVRYDYGKVYGSATCLSSEEVASLLPSADDELIGLSGTDPNGNARTQCYCRLTHPMSSNWEFNLGRDQNLCESACASYCTQPDVYNSTVRYKMFNSIGASMAETE